MLKREEHSNFSAQGLGLTEAGIKSFLGLPLNEQYVLTSAVGLPFASAGGLFADLLSFVD